MTRKSIPVCAKNRVIVNMVIILDRDGVINYDSVSYVKSPEEFIFIPGSLEAIAALKLAGFTVVIATNQSGLARKLYDEEMLTKIHDKLLINLKEVGGSLDGIYYCPHLPEHLCECRKPKSGLLKTIALDFSIDLTKQAVFIGDSLRDIQAAQSVNCPVILVETGNGRKTLQENPTLSQKIEVCADLAEAANRLIILNA